MVRGWVGTFSNGYCSVTVGRNIEEMVIPKPATGANSLPRAPFSSGANRMGSRRVTSPRVRALSMSLDISFLLNHGGARLPAAGARRFRQVLPRQWRHGVAAREGVERLV